MIYVIIAAAIVVVSSVKCVSFGVWNIKRGNISGGTAVILLSAAAVAAIGTKIKL